MISAIELPEWSEDLRGAPRTKVYLSGPMTGKPEFNYPLFFEAAAELEKNGFEVLNPARRPVREDWEWADYLRADLADLALVDEVVVLPGWEDSRGASLEVHIAHKLGMPVWEFQTGATVSLDSNGRPCLPSEVEGDEVRVTNEATGGQKGQKLARFDLLPVEPLTEVARHYGRGARKYEDRNWEKGYDWSLSYGALMRHAMQFWGGEDIDEETGSHHLAGVVFHALALMEFGRTHPELDDRPGVSANGAA